MGVEVQAVAPEQVQADVVAVPLVGDNKLAGTAAALDSKLDGLLGRLVADGELRGESGRVSVVHGDGKLGTRRAAAPGLGPREHLDADALRAAAAAVARETGDYAESVAWVIDEALDLPAEEQARALVEGTAIGNYDTACWKQDEPESKLGTLVLCCEGDGLAAAAKRAATVAEWTNRARDLVNSPPNETTPQRLAARARGVAASLGHATPA